ncbi:MAG: Hpt domain-containing protein [Clostridia bacterium]|nr:Hpt domain-containing protein [Clostridia bacterium]
MDNGMESMLDTYLYETNSLLDQLDEMLVADEKSGEFSSDDVNEIFRIMHTIKGSSAMMEFGSLSVIAHHIEDLFFYIRDKGIESLNQEQKKELFNLMFRSEDFLRSEVEKAEQGAPLSDNLDSFALEINDFLKKISNPEGNVSGNSPSDSKNGTEKNR